jgi:2-polyprenyl-3-methyl-5-hydroxy-6-metoxy-1,4-benzoquinol methylase
MGEIRSNGALDAQPFATPIMASAGRAEPRFEFGKNWQRFLTALNEERIVRADASLKSMLNLPDLRGKSFLDIGSGSGLFSLAAMRLGAERVHSFDYDPDSVACTRELKRRFYPDSDRWTIERGSALDPDYLSQLNRWDIVYSWGVLHHTGNMWQALANAAELVQPGGLLFISLYNDQGRLSRFWQKVKLFYNQGRLARIIALALFIPVYVVGSFVRDIFNLTNPLRRYRMLDRGMSIVYDWVDWLGGYPFEVARPDEVIQFYKERGFGIDQLRTVGGKSACNEFVFKLAEN